MSSTIVSRSVDTSNKGTRSPIKPSEDARKIRDERSLDAKAISGQKNQDVQTKPSAKWSSKKRKRSSPFRIKVGCIVALRYRPGENQVTLESTQGVSLTDQIASASDNVSSFSEVWTDPQPGRDEGLALVGCRIRCCFPKLVLSETFHKRATTRLLEGEVVSIADYHHQLRQQRDSRRRREAHGTKVHLLIDKDRLEALPFLKRIDYDIDLSKLSESAKRAYINEQQIRGENKVIVQVLLSDSSGIILDKSTTNLEARWVIRKRVPTKKLSTRLPRALVTRIDASGTSHHETPERAIIAQTSREQGRSDDAEKTNVVYSNGNRESSSSEPPKRRRRMVATKDFSAPQYLGDGNDSRNQQEANWRWQASRYNPFSFLKEAIITSNLIERLSYNFVGEVIRIQPASPTSNTLAIVTIKRLVLPEHTESGRMSHHGANEVFEDLDSNLASIGTPNKGKSSEVFFYRVPIEELVIVNKRLNRTFEIPSEDLIFQKEMNVTQSYSLCLDKFVQLSDAKNVPNNMEFDDSKLCSRCRRVTRPAKRPHDANHWRCECCINILEASGIGKRRCLLQAEVSCDCLDCQKRDYADRKSQLFHATSKAARKMDSTLQSLEQSGVDRAGFFATRLVIKCMNRVDFSTLQDFPPPARPSSKLIIRMKSRSPKKARKPSARPPSLLSDNSAKIKDKKRSGDEPRHAYSTSSQDKTGYRPTCSRLLPYNVQSRRFEVSADELCPWVGGSSQFRDKPRNLRPTSHDPSGAGETDKEEKANSRAARANQRRLLRDVAAIGVSFDALAGREQQLRFDRSSIHAWGVFADEDIKEGEMLVEYRGEIIGNSMAEKREKEYENAKIGSDYMFRIDGLSVCDATKQGNVARFINANCDPNCFTKIISIDGVKRIVVYAKRDIGVGEELCYDYKFPLEYDEAKRIPCHCGSRECRGFMNWDKRYVALPAEGLEGNRIARRTVGDDSASK